MDRNANRIHKLLALVGILCGMALLTLNTGCDRQALSPDEIKVQERAAWPLFW